MPTHLKKLNEKNYKKTKTHPHISVVSMEKFRAEV